jgi:CheY-specific phosphatase CheX
MKPDGLVDLGLAMELNLTNAELLTILRDGAEDVFTMIRSVGKLVDDDHVLDGHGVPHPAVKNIAYEVRVEFFGPWDGVVVMRCQEACASSITSGMLIMDANETLSQSAFQVVHGEETNMLEGFFKRQVLDPQGTFRLGIPTIAKAEVADYADEHGSLIYELSDNRASVEVWLDGQK